MSELKTIVSSLRAMVREQHARDANDELPTDIGLALRELLGALRDHPEHVLVRDLWPVPLPAVRPPTPPATGWWAQLAKLADETELLIVSTDGLVSNGYSVADWKRLCVDLEAAGLLVDEPAGHVMNRAAFCVRLQDVDALADELRSN